MRGSKIFTLDVRKNKNSFKFDMKSTFGRLPQFTHRILLVIAAILLAACVTTPTTQNAFDKEAAIAHSYNLLREQGLLKIEWPYDNAVYAPIVFPNGDKGAFVAMGFCCPAHGHQFLYRFGNDQPELVQLLNNDQNWGMRTLSPSDKVDLEFVELYRDQYGKSKQLLKVTGASHIGSGLATENDFQLIEITDDGIKVVFAGSEVSINGNNGGHDKRYSYQFVDSDGDGNKEIIQTGEECGYQVAGNDLVETNCKNAKRIYQYNGAEYVLVP